MFEAEFWVAVSFLIFVAIIWKVGGFRTMTKGLDQRAQRIRAELDEAKRLREEAAQVLASYKKRREEAEREAEDIVAAARKEAERVSRETQQRMQDFVARRTAAAEAKIAQAETQATAQVRAAAAEAAVRVSETILKERVTGETAQNLLSRSLAEVRTMLIS